MSRFRTPLNRTNPRRAGTRSFALIATLALLAIATLLLVIFVSTMAIDRSASGSYGQSVKADQIAEGGLHLVVSQLQAEMYKDGLPDTGGGTYPNTPIFANVIPYNIRPQANVTNSDLLPLIKMSTNAPFFIGTNSVTSYDTGLQQGTSSSVSSTTPSFNGRAVSLNVWNQSFFGTYKSTAEAPDWLLMTRAGPTNGAGLGFGGTGNTLNSSAVANSNYVVGRIAYAIYDEGGLLDVTAAGYPGSGSSAALSSAQLAQIKGTLAGADLSVVGVASPSDFIKWRNATTATTASSYLSYITNFASTNGFLQASPGDSTFLSRQDLIKAAQNNIAGLNAGTAATVLPNLTTFTRELNAPSWAPSLNGTAATKYQYANNAIKITTSPFTTTQGVNKAGGENPNPFIPLVRFANGGLVSYYPADGTAPTTYKVNAGDPLVQRRFPLGRLNWITPKGPSALLAPGDAFYNPGGTAAAILACFGLVWGSAENTQPTFADTNWSGINVWKYYGSNLTSITTSEPSPTNSTSSVIETLSDVAKETVVREPNFFELLQAGVLSGSVALSTGSSQSMQSTGQSYVSLQLLQIAANILTQVQPQAYPINVEYKEKDAGTALSIVASGIANLPYIDKLKFVTGESGDGPNSGDTTKPNRQMAVYGLVGLWNPHQQPTTALIRPVIRLYIQGDFSVGSGWANQSVGYANLVIPASANNGTGTAWAQGGKGYVATVQPNTAYVELKQTAGVGSSGFLNPYALGYRDVASFSPGGSSSGAGWSATQTSGVGAMVSGSEPEGSFVYEGFRLPDLLVNLQPNSPNVPGDGTTAGIENTAVPESHVIVYLGPNGTVASNPFQLVMKYQDFSGKWVPYSYFDGVSSSITWTGSSGNPLSTTQTLITEPLDTTGHNTKAPFALPTPDQALHSTNGHSGTWIRDDPRSFRFGPIGLSGDLSGGMGSISNIMIDSIWSGSGNATGSGNSNNTMLITGYGGASSVGAAGIPTESGTLPTIFGTVFLPAYLSRNNTAYPNSTAPGSPGAAFTAYQDPDAIQRIADSGLFPTTVPVTAAAITGNPYYDPSDNVSTAGQRTGDRPIILNRPFASVGELGYVFRDDPWRSLDFFSVFHGVSTSADSGLLDLFSVTDTPTPLTAGRVSLNSNNPLVLQAVLSGTLADSPGNTLPSPYNLSDPADMASALVNYTSATGTPQSLVNKDQLVTKFNPTLPSGSSVASPFGTVDEQNVKSFREAFIRALADAGQTRTWNLMIDIVAQAGRYPPTATTLSQFDVQGERHYWLHIAIDRFTGKIIDRQLELVDP